jgi:hypothetical protein
MHGVRISIQKVCRKAVDFIDLVNWTLYIATYATKSYHAYAVKLIFLIFTRKNKICCPYSDCDRTVKRGAMKIHIDSVHLGWPIHVLIPRVHAILKRKVTYLSCGKGSQPVTSLLYCGWLYSVVVDKHVLKAHINPNTTDRLRTTDGCTACS